MSATNHVFSAFSFITLILVLIPLPWHLEAWNMGTVIYMGWTSVTLLIYFINSVVWDGSIEIVAPVWCDISTKLMIGASIGIPAASLCINRRLYVISRANALGMDKRDKRKQAAIDASIGILIPIIYMALHYVVQGHRFDIYEDFGCVPSTYNVTLTYVLLQPPMFILPIASCIFAILSIRNFIKRDVQFNTLLSGSSLSKSNESENTVSSLTGSRYLRLMMLASMEIIIGFPTTLAVCVINTTILGPVNPWISWEDTHFDFWTVDRYTAAQWRVGGTSTALVEWNRWMSVVCGLLFFAFFGFAQEARRNYGKVWGVMGRCAPGVGKTFEAFAGKRESFGNMKLNSAGSSFHATSNFARFKVTTPGTGGNSSNAALPIYVEKEIINKRDSFDTFTSADLVSLRSGSGSTIMKLSSIAGPTKTNTPTSSASQSRSSSPTRPRPRMEVTPETCTEVSERHAVQMGLRTPETAFPRAVTPDVETRRLALPVEDSFLEMVTPEAEGFSPLARVETLKAALRRGDNWV